MATATLTRPKRKAKVPPIIPHDENDDNRSGAFFMPAGSMSLEEFRQWTWSDDFPERGKIAYIGKEIFIDMSPERIISHGSVKTAVCGTVMTLNRKKKKGKFYMDRTRFVHPSAEVSNEPDAFFATWETLRSGRLRKIPTADGQDYIELEGSPDWILEIVSPGSVTKDTKKLKLRYHKAGVAEYWLVDARGEEVDFQILVRGESEYESAKSSGDWQFSPVFGKKFRLRRIKDELGDVDHRLDVK